MYLRRRQVTGAGAVFAATAVVVLSGSPAQANCATEVADQQWQVGAQLGPAPVQLTGNGGLPALLLSAIPESSIQVRGASGQNLLRLAATSTTVGTPVSADSPNLADSLDPHALGVDPIAGVGVVPEAGAHAVDATGAPDAAERLFPAAARPDSVAAPGQEQVPLRAAGSGSAFGNAYAWVPIEGIGGLGTDGAGTPWAAGLAIAALAGGTAAVTVVARRRRELAG